jgi:hypothetical protein
LKCSTQCIECDPPPPPPHQHTHFAHTKMQHHTNTQTNRIPRCATTCRSHSRVHVSHAALSLRNGKVGFPDAEQHVYFVDTFGAERSRTWIPTVEAGDFYLRLTQSCLRVLALAAGSGATSCDVNGELCCNRTFAQFTRIFSLKSTPNGTQGNSHPLTNPPTHPPIRSPLSPAGTTTYYHRQHQHHHHHEQPTCAAVNVPRPHLLPRTFVDHHASLLLTVTQHWPHHRVHRLPCHQLGR